MPISAEKPMNTIGWKDFVFLMILVNTHKRTASANPFQLRVKVCSVVPPTTTKVDIITLIPAAAIRPVDGA